MDRIDPENLHANNSWAKHRTKAKRPTMHTKIDPLDAINTNDRGIGRSPRQNAGKMAAVGRRRHTTGD